MRHFACFAFALAVPLFAYGCSDNASPASQGGDQDAGDTTDGGDQSDVSTGVGGGPGFSNSISLIVEPSDHGDALLAAIQNAKTSVHMTMYLLTDNDITNALVAQRNAGHDVKVVLNQTFPSGQGNSNADAFTTLQAADPNMVVYASDSFTYTHEKCVIIDGTSAWIMTMNAAYSSPTANREFLAIDTDSADVAEADAIFQGDFTHSSVSPTGNLLVAPDNDKDRIRGLIGTAAQSLDLELEELSDSDVVGDLAGKADSGVKIRIVMADEAGSSAQKNAIANLKSHGVTLVATSTPYIHAKAIIVDGISMYVGSANLTQNSMENNRELAIVTTQADAIGSVQTAMDTDFANGTAL